MSGAAGDGGPATRARPVALAALAVLVSILLRAPNLGRPLSDRHEFLTAHALVTAEVWRSGGGPACYHFSPAYTFPNAGDAFVPRLAGLSGVSDGRGTFYYVSYPPFGYLLPYGLFAVLGVTPGPLPIQILNLGLHVVSAVGVLLATRTLLGPRHRAAWIAFVAYIFAPGSLWYQSNVYSPEIAAQPFWVLGIALALRALAAGRARPALVVGLASTTFVLLYTEWLGALFAAAVFAAALARRRLDVAVPVALAAAAALILIVVQYASIAGLEGTLAFFRQKLAQRSGIVVERADQGLGFATAASYLRLARSFAISYGALLPSLAALAWAGRGGLLPLDPDGRSRTATFLFVAGAPALAHHLLLFNFTVIHEFALLKDAPLLCAILALAGARALEVARLPRAALLGIGGGTVALCMGAYLVVNPPGRAEYGRFETFGAAIRAEARPEEVVFATSPHVGPQSVYYARRNVVSVGTRDEALGWLREHGKPAGVWFVQDRIDAPPRVERLAAE